MCRWRFFYFNDKHDISDFVPTFSRNSIGNTPLLTILSKTRSAICSKPCASISNMTVPFKRRLLNSKSECSDNVATWGLLHLLPPSSTSSSNLIHLRIYDICTYSRCLKLFSFFFKFDDFVKFYVQIKNFDLLLFKTLQTKIIINSNWNKRSSWTIFPRDKIHTIWNPRFQCITS